MELQILVLSLKVPFELVEVLVERLLGIFGHGILDGVDDILIVGDDSGSLVLGVIASKIRAVQILRNHLGDIHLRSLFKLGGIALGDSPRLQVMPASLLAMTLRRALGVVRVDGPWSSQSSCHQGREDG